MQAKVEKRGPPLRGAFFYAPPEGERENAQVGFNLDENIAVARLTDHNKDIGDAGYLGDEYFKSYNIPLKLGEDQVITIVSSTSSYYYAWYIELEVQAGGSTHYIKVDRRGNMNAELGLFPFEISARADSREHEKGVFSVYKELYVLRKAPSTRARTPSALYLSIQTLTVHRGDSALQTAQSIHTPGLSSLTQRSLIWPVDARRGTRPESSRQRRRPGRRGATASSQLNQRCDGGTRGMLAFRSVLSVLVRSL